MPIPGVGIYTLNGFLGLVLGQAVLRAIHPGDPGYATSVRSTMQIGAVGSGVLCVAIWAVVLMLLCLAAVSRNVKGFARTMNMSTSIRKDLGSLAFYTAVGAASGPLGIAILKHHRNASQRADMLNVSDAARVGALGWAHSGGRTRVVPSRSVVVVEPPVEHLEEQGPGRPTADLMAFYV
ncbi:uncharacterized protein C8Q71DRAFT_375011 [Rhodofomes roseus]|uniref:Uncharacterized protein n=1 Tax=Rhodofomes roseus TaxID=34475 RepID=A0ABQ8K0Z3_9APHY|nr:uncharacterized protein C8Q71DRAFT_375011 [Rhodofomes roseus]KAH9830321.1 hypothetical protein C8Q71DRAFT_375011 [Rhodofomes roseus]